MSSSIPIILVAVGTWKFIQKRFMDFPGGAVGHGFKPWSGKIPHATEQLSPCATATEPALQIP